jgi:hypothetical protein
MEELGHVVTYLLTMEDENHAITRFAKTFDPALD